MKKRGLNFIAHVIAATFGSLLAGLVVLGVLYAVDEAARRKPEKKEA